MQNISLKNFISSWQQLIVPPTLLAHHHSWPATHIQTHKATKIHTLRHRHLSYTLYFFKIAQKWCAVEMCSAKLRNDLEHKQTTEWNQHPIYQHNSHADTCNFKPSCGRVVKERICFQLNHWINQTWLESTVTWTSSVLNKMVVKRL